MIVYTTSLENVKPENLQGFFVGWNNPLTPEQHFQILQNSQYVVLAIDTLSEMVVGFVNALSDRVQFAFIPMLEVLPDYQRNEIGRNLMRKMLKQLEHIGCIDLTCDIDMQDFYAQFGMVKSKGMIIRR